MSKNNKKPRGGDILSSFYDPRKYDNDYVLDNIGHYIQDHYTNLYSSNNEKDAKLNDEESEEDKTDYMSDMNVYMSNYTKF